MGFWCILRRLVAATAFLSCGVYCAAAADVPSHYVRQSDGSDIAIVFVNGVLGDSTTTWTNGTSYWPTLLTADPKFNDADIFVYSYPTGVWATESIDELAENMRLQLNANGVSAHHHLVFLAHSMGGLVTRAYLLKNREAAARTSFVYFYSTPAGGSDIASLVALISGNPQFSKMKPMNADDYLADLLRQWLAAQFTIPTYCAYEKRKTYGFSIVTFMSASPLCTMPLDPIDTNHIDIVKPENKDSDSYLAFKAAYRDQMAHLCPSAAVVAQFQAVLNALHATQIHKAEDLFPGLLAYMDNPTEGNWNNVRVTARELTEEIRSSVTAAMNFDSQFYNEGQQIILISLGAREIVDRSYHNQFHTSREEWNGFKNVLRDVITTELRPTADQALQWANDLKRRYDAMNEEISRLLASRQQHC